MNILSTVGFFAGDWSEIHHLLLHGSDVDHQNKEDSCTKDVACDGYDIILMAETVYSLASLENLYELIKKVCVYIIFLIVTIYASIKIKF